MRGKVEKSAENLRYVGITPAYAGKSGGAAGILKIKQDHPRLCGEKALSVDVHSSMTGSPPPMRGKD